MKSVQNRDQTGPAMHQKYRALSSAKENTMRLHV